MYPHSEPVTDMFDLSDESRQSSIKEVQKSLNNTLVCFKSHLCHSKKNPSSRMKNVAFSLSLALSGRVI